MKIFAADSSAMMRISELDRTEEIVSKYRGVLAADGRSIVLQVDELNPPEIFPNWSAEGVLARATRWQKIVEDGGALFLAEDNGRVIGVGVLSGKDDNDNGELVALFVDRTYRGQGVGRRLVQRLEEAARARQMECVYVYSNETVTTVQFYEHLGYHIICVLDNSLMWLPWMGTSIALAKKF